MSLLFSFCLLLVTFCLLLVTFCSLFVTFSSRLLWNKITVYRKKKWFDYNETSAQVFSLQISEILVSYSGWWFSKFFQHTKPFSNLTESHKYCLNLYHFDVSITISGHVFIYFYVLEGSEVVAWRSSIKILKHFTKFTRKYLRWGLFCNNAAGWRHATLLNT